MDTLRQMLDENDARRATDAERFHALDPDLCQLCHAHGEDKRSLRLSCLYAVHEVVPEAIDMHGIDESRDYYLRICKSCRGRFLTMLQEWRAERVALRDEPKDHDGHISVANSDRCVPVREHGVIRWFTEEEFEQFQRHHEGMRKCSYPGGVDRWTTTDAESE